MLGYVFFFSKNQNITFNISHSWNAPKTHERDAKIGLEYTRLAYFLLFL